MNTMRFTRLELQNWKNFTKVDVELADRVFIIGPNAIGKSNLLDVFRFLRDLAIEERGGLASALSADVRGGVGKVRSAYARHNSDVMVRVTVREEDKTGWRYGLAFNSQNGASSRPVVVKETVHRLLADGLEEIVLERPSPDDERDRELLSQTAIQQVTANKAFRPLADFFRGVSYLHIVPQLLREGQAPRAGGIGPDPYGRDLLDRIRNTPPREQKARLKRIENVLRVVTPQLTRLHLKTDDHGRPHLEANLSHWRPRGTYQNETQFSDGTLRLTGLLWSLQDRAGPLLLEEPELSLHAAIVRRLAPFIHRAQRSGNGRQVILSTHSELLLTDMGIAPEEVVLVQPATEGSEVVSGASQKQIVRLMQSGLLASEAAYPVTEMDQMHFFDQMTP